MFIETVFSKFGKTRMQQNSRIPKNMLPKCWNIFQNGLKKTTTHRPRTMSKFTVDTHDPSRWQPTPPAYVEDVEPHWNKIRTLVLGSAAQFKPRKHPEFSLKKIVIFIKNSKKYMISVNGLQKPEMILKKFRLHSFGIVTPMFR